MRALLFFYQFWVLIFYCCGVPNSQKQWLSILKPRISPMPVSSEIPWLISMPETCQGIILSQWWILSTANCLTKLKHLQSDSSGIVNQEDILLGYNICLHPSFDPQVVTNPVKGDIGLVLLPYPISSEEIPLSYTYNIFQKSCYNCQYRHCRVYQYQNHDKFGTSIKKLSVKLLDLSFCQHQQIHLTRSNNLCIWTQPQEDCWVQQGSPVICFFGNHWELVGLVSESSVACYYPIVVIKTAPYRSWMRWLMKASQKSLDPIFSLLCSFSSGVKNGTKNSLSLNRNPTILTSRGLPTQPWKGRLGTLPLIRQHRNPLRVFFGLNNRDTSPDSTQLYFQNSQLSSAKKFPWTSIVARLWDTLDTTEPWSSSGTGSFQPSVLSDATKLSTAEIPIPWDFPQRDVSKYHHQTMTDSVKPQVKPLVGIIGFHTLPLVNAGGSWVLFSTDIDASQLHSELKTSQSQITRFSNLAFHSQLPAKPWLEITPNVGSWIHFVPDKTVMQIQSSEESIRTQTYHATDRVMVKPVTYSLHTGVPLIVNKIEFGTHSTVNADGFQYLTATHNLETWFQPMLNTIGAQASIKRTNEYWIPESMSNQFFTSPAHYVPFTWVPSANNNSTSWAQYKISMIRPSNQMDRITSLSRHKTFILKPQVKTEDTPWLLINTIKPSIHYKIDTIRPWIQAETEIVRPLTQYETGSKQLGTNPEASSLRHWTQSKLNLVIPVTKSELDTASLWLYMQTDTTGTWNQPESQKIISWSGSETDRVKSWYHSQMNSFKPWLKTELQTAKFWSQYEGDIARMWPQSETDNVKRWFQKQKETVTLLTEPITQTVYHWIQSEAELGRSWNQPMSDKVRAWIQHEAYTISPIFDEYDGDKDRLWTLLAADTIKQWIQSDDSTITPWVQNEARILTLYTQTESPEVNPWTQTEIETVTLLTQGEKTGVNHWSEILSETVTTWEKSEFPGLKSLTHSISDTVTLWTQTESPVLNLWPQPIADTLIQWLKNKPSEINSWSKTISNTATAWAQDESITMNTWTQSENDTVILWSQTESSAINPWTQSIVDTITEWMQDESSEIIPWEKIVSDQLLLWTYTETPVYPWKQSETDTPYQTGLSLSPSPTESPGGETVSGTVTQWSQVDSLVFNSPTQIITDTVTLYMPAKTPSFHSWAMSETDAVITRTSAESLVLSSLKGCETEIVPTWSKRGYSEVNLWTQLETGIVTSWAQVETPGANSFTQSVVNTVPPWIQAKSSVVNLWTQSVVDVDTLWTQTGSPAVNPRTESVSDSAVQWKQNETGTISQWTQTASDTVKSFSQVEFPIVESLINIVTDIVTLWTEFESTAVIPWTEVVATAVPSFNQTEYPSVTPWTTLETDPAMVWTHANSDIINLLTQTLYHTATLWTYGAILNSWTHYETDTGTAWTHPESSTINTWAWSETKPVTSLSERRYPALNLWTQTEANKIAPWSQTESTAMNSWIHLENDTVTTFIQGESKVLNQSSVVLTSTVKAWTQVDTPVLNPSTQTDNDRVTLWTKSEILAAYPLTIAVSDTVKVWNMAEIISVKSWPYSVTETGTHWTQNEFPLVYHLTQSITNSVTLITQTINLAMNSRMRLDATAVTPWTQAESPQENARTISKTVIPWTMEFSTIVKSLMETSSDTIMPRTKSEFSEVKVGTSSGASIVPPWTQAESPTVNPWTQSQVHTVTKWTQNDSPTNTLTQAKFAAGNTWTQFELPTINIFTKSRFPVLHPSVQTESHTITSSTRAGFLAINPWTEIQPTTVTLWIQAEYPIANSWTISETDIATLGIVVESPSSSLTKSEKPNGLPWTQKESPVNPVMQDRANIFTMWTKTEFLANPWMKKIADIVTGQTLDKSPIVNYWTDTFASGATPLTHESPVLNPWAQAITSTLTQWHMVESPTVNPQEETVVSTVAPWIQFESPSVNSQAGTIVSTVAWLNQAESPAVIPCTETVTLWMQESTVGNSCSQTTVSIKTPLHAEFPWSDIVGATVTTWNKTETLADKVASIITMWPQYESPAVNPRVHTVVSTVAPWNEVKYVMINPWTQIPSSTVIPWTQTSLPALNVWTQTIFSTMLPWTQDERTTNSLTDTVVSTVIPWTHAVSPKIKTWAETISSEISPWIYTVSPTVETWSDSVSMVTSWTQFLSSEYPSTVTVSSTVTCWTHSESPGISSCTENEIDRAIFWTLLKTESKKEWTLPEASIFSKSLHPQSDTSESVIQIQKPSSLLGVHPEISNIQNFPITGMFMSWIIPLTQAAIFLLKPEVDMSRSWFKTETVRTTHGIQSEYEIVSTLTQFGVKRGDSFTQYETDPLTSWTQTKTGIFHPWNQFERNTMRTSTFSEADAVGPWIQTDPGLVTPWIQHNSGIITSWTKVDSNTVGLQTQTEVTTVTQLSQTDISAVNHLTTTGINNFIPKFQNQPDTVRSGTQPESQIITSRIRPEGEFVHSWTQSEAKTKLTYFEIPTVKPWPRPESQVVSTLTDTDTVTFWAPTQNDVIGPWSQIEIQATCSVIPSEVGLINPQSQSETSLIRPWTDLQSSKVQPCIHLEAAINRPWAQYETVEINPSIQLESDTAVRPWLQTQRDSIVSEFDTLISCLQTQGATTRPWIHESVSPWTQTEVGIILSCTQQRAITDQPWTHHETQAIKPWIKLEANTIKSWFHLQMNKVRPWANSKSPIVSALVQPEVGIVHPWIHPEIQAAQPWNHPETDFTASAKLPKSDSVRVRVQPEIQIRNSTHYKAGLNTLFASLEVEPDGGTNTLTSHFDSWPKPVPLLSKETVSLPNEYFVTLPTEIAATESQPQITFFHPSEFTKNFLLTLSSPWISERVDYLDHGSELQITKTKGSPYMPTNSPSPLSPSFSFLPPFSLHSSCILFPSCSVLSSCTFTSSGISPSCSILSPITFFSPILHPLASADSSLQGLSSSKFSEETILSHTFSSLFAAPATLLTKQPSLIRGSQSETNSNHPEQDPLKYSEFNISLAECRLGVVWKESFQAFWLFKTAIISHESTECGLRPGLIPHCPNCWEAEVGEFPWMVSVQLSFSHFCAGSILNEQWILTTARCANFIKNSESLALVQVGLIDLQDSAQAQTIGIHRAIPYLGPKGPLGPGLLFLKQPLRFQPLVLPICLVENMEQDKNIQLYDCWLPSWSLMRGSPGILQKRHLSILQVSTCAQFWPKLNEFTFCVEAKKAMGEAGCKGDLGAPLVCHLQQKDTWVQVGILSHFDEHCTKPYVFSQVSPFLFWLQGVTRPSHAPWSQQGPMTTSASISTSRNASAFTSTPASIRPHFISLPQPQTLADRISLRYAMPWQVMIISCGNQICSGSIVSSSWVLTAAHCVRHMNPEDTAVILGLRHPGTPLRVVKVSAILLHERFRLVSGTARNDLALLLLQEVQTPIQIFAPLGNSKNLNTSECWLAGPRFLKQGEADDNPEALQMQVMGASSCAHLYPDIGSSIVCFVTQAKTSNNNVEPVSPGSAVMCRPMAGNGSWRQIGLTSLKTLATIVSPHFSWILSTSAKAGRPLNQAVMPWLEKPRSSSSLTQSSTLLLLTVIVMVVFCDPVVIAK